MNFCVRFSLTNVYKSVRGLFLFCLDLDVFAKNKKTWFLQLVFYIFINNSRSKQNKKKLVKVFNFSYKKPGLLEIIGFCLNLGIEFCITLVLPNSKKNYTVKINVK